MEIIINNTFFTGKFLIHLPSIDSTNTYAKEHLSKSTPIDGTVILADEQYAGRGQAGNIWQSEPEQNLTFSIIYKTDFLKATEQFDLNMAISLGIRSAVSEILELNKRENTEVSIKWPNDIYINEKKVAGILIENTISGMHLKYSVIGIGLNVNQQDFPDLAGATSLRQVLNIDTNRILFLKSVLAAIEKYFFWVKERRTELLTYKYKEHLYRMNTVSNYSKNGQTFSGTITGITDSGQLMMEVMQEDGNCCLMTFAFKEISFE